MTTEDKYEVEQDLGRDAELGELLKDLRPSAELSADERGRAIQEILDRSDLPLRRMSRRPGLGALGGEWARKLIPIGLAAELLLGFGIQELTQPEPTEAALSATEVLTVLNLLETETGRQVLEGTLGQGLTLEALRPEGEDDQGDDDE